jgi:hypothetical protein
LLIERRDGGTDVETDEGDDGTALAPPTSDMTYSPRTVAADEFVLRRAAA